MPNELLEHNPLLRQPLLLVLAACLEQESTCRQEIEASVIDRNPGAFHRQAPATVVNILVRNGMIEEQLVINQDSYGGSLAEAQTDEHLDDDAQIEQRIFVTNKGRQILDEYSPDIRLRALLDSRPEYSRVFCKILTLCADNSKGQSRADLEQELMKDPLLQPDSFGASAIYPQYFLDALESAGGIVWRDSWFTTKAGKAVVAQFQSQFEC
jgi:hypothetical protein